jgi:hypothetical protein
MTETITANYKGELQQYCQKRGLGPPVYDSVHHGTPNDPSWIITITYGSSTYTTPEPIRGSKRNAEHLAAKQVLEAIQTQQEAFLAGEPLDEQLQLDVSEAPTPAETIYAPAELVTTALGIANHRLSELRRGVRYRESPESKQSNQVFAQNVAELTMEIVRQVVKAAEASGVKFADAPKMGKNPDGYVQSKADQYP